ncbi:alginate lyase family protein [Desulfuromonas sp. TF]|uniref:heparinase II/III family protein n=1 Tax=Desulfuromonas sp. TF TaxID=1232410 RepID=UPI0004298004|nr:alginate lyase family protein [Desulfuromonas sp. TF]
MTKLTWYFNRVRQMSAGEIGSRIVTKVRSHAEQFGLATCRRPPLPLNLERSRNFISNFSIGNPSPYIATADSLLQGKLDLFALKEGGYGNPPEWNRDPRSGITAPLSFGKTLDYRDSLLVGDIKYLWEPNRHLQLVTLAQAYRLSGDARYLDGIGLLLQSWLDQCPYLKGPNWCSSLELGIRLINWSVVWQTIGGLESPLFQGRGGKALLGNWLDSIYRHVHFIRYHFSRFSSANNHLIGEAAGLFISTCTWPFWKEFFNCRKLAHRILVQEILNQTFPDGVGKEQAISYQQFVLDFFLLSALAGRECSVEFPPAYWRRVERMLEFIASVMDTGGNVPSIGDGDDGFVVRLSREPDFCPYKSLLATGAVLFKRGDFKAKAGRLDDKTRWLLGQEGEQVFSSLAAKKNRPPIRLAYPDGGYYIMGCHWETPREIRLIADAGPLGYLSIAAHGHADALSFILSVGGREILIDPGTYAYHNNRKWRDYFRGTSAHNTLCVDGQDQSVPGGNFMWLKKADAKCRLWEENEKECRFIGTQNGYLRLPDPVRHTREIVLQQEENRILVTDTLECRGEHRIERFWHFAENCRVQQTESGLVVENRGITLNFQTLDDPEQVAIRVGQESPPCGWISRRYDEKEVISTAVFLNQILGKTRLTTQIDIFIPPEFKGSEEVL